MNNNLTWKSYAIILLQLFICKFLANTISVYCFSANEHSNLYSLIIYIVILLLGFNMAKTYREYEGNKIVRYVLWLTKECKILEIILNTSYALILLSIASSINNGLGAMSIIHLIVGLCLECFVCWKKAIMIRDYEN